MSIGPFQILIIALVILVMFGRGKVSELLGDVGKGVKSFRQGLVDDQDPAVQLDPAPRETHAGERTAG